VEFRAKATSDDLAITVLSKSKKAARTYPCRSGCICDAPDHATKADAHSCAASARVIKIT